MVTKRPTDKNTKSEILSAFDELMKEKKALETQLAQKPQAAVTNGNSTNGKTVSLPQPITMTTILQDLSRLQLSFGSAVSHLSEQLTSEALKLQNLQQSVTEEAEQLVSLHNLQPETANLDNLIQQYGDSFKTFNQELTQQRETLEQEFSQAKKTWAKEQEDHRRLIKERNETLQKLTQRESKEYSYALTLQRKLAKDEHDQASQRLYQQLETARKALEKQWDDRETELAEREKQFADLKAKVEAFPKELETAIKRYKEEGKGIGNHQARVKADLRAKEVEGQKRFYEVRIQALQETISTQDNRIQSLSKQLDAALKQVQDLAVKAIEGASNANSFQAMREIAIEQAKTQSKNK